MRRVPLWCWWGAIVWAISAPWSGACTSPQWSRVQWLPFASSADGPADVLANCALFVPFGWSLAARVRSAARVTLAAGALSTSAEALQLFSLTRHPSATDVLSALAGAALGAVARGRKR